MRENMDILIRRANRSDMEAVRRILNHYIEHTPFVWSDTPRQPREAMRMYRSHQFSDRTPLLVAEQDGAVIGFSALVRVSMAEGWREVAEDMVYVHPAWVGHGVGTRLLEGVMERGAKTGLCAVLSKIDAENAASLALHRAFGFEEYGVLRDVGVKFGKRRSCVNLVYYYGETSPV